MSHTQPRNLGAYLDRHAPELALEAERLSSRSYGPTAGEHVFERSEIRAAFADPARFTGVPCEYDAAEDPDTAERLHRMDVPQLLRTTRPHQASVLDPAVEWMRREFGTLPVWFVTFLRCFGVALLVGGVGYLLLTVYVWISFWGNR